MVLAALLILGVVGGAYAFHETTIEENTQVFAEVDNSSDEFSFIAHTTNDGNELRVGVTFSENSSTQPIRTWHYDECHEWESCWGSGDRTDRLDYDIEQGTLVVPDTPMYVFIDPRGDGNKPLYYEITRDDDNELQYERVEG